jgi:uncharacterized protein (TIGR00288 family)
MKQDRVALLIDADNVSIDVIEQAVVWCAKHYGGPHLRRAYCTPESAVKHQTAFKRLSVRPMVNLAAGKNSTDIALAVDAIEIAVNEQPDVIVIASSDSDFAPVVARLRERGCRVVGLGQQGKVGQETQGIYDDYEIFEHRGGSSADEASPAPRKRSARAGAKRATGTRGTTAAKKAGKAGTSTAAKKAAAGKASRAAKSPAGATASSAKDAADATTTAPAPAKSRARKSARKTTTPDDLVARDDDAVADVFADILAEAAAESAADAATGRDSPTRKASRASKPAAAKKTRGRKTTASDAASPSSAPEDHDEDGSAGDVSPLRGDDARGRRSDQRDDVNAARGSPSAVTLEAVLRALPELARGATLAFNDVGQRLRVAGLLSKSGSSTKLLRQFAGDVALEPADKPSRVRLVSHG